MRDLLNRLDEIVLTEKARGLLYRDPGDIFFQGSLENPSAEIVFRDIEFYPSNPGAYGSYEEMEAAGQQLSRHYPKGITWSNQPGSRSRAFAIITFDGPGKNETTSFGRFFDQIKADMTGLWKNNELPGGWQLKKASSLKGSYYKLKPSDLFPPDSSFSSPRDCVAAIGTNPGSTTPGQADAIAKIRPGMSMLLKGEFPIFENVDSMESAVRDDLGETIGPIALIQGMITTGGAEAARKDILGNQGSYAGSSIYFPASKINGLVDSYITTPEGIEIGISSKGEDGATASVKNIADGVEAAKKKNMTDLIKQYAEQIKVIERVGSLSSLELPLVLGQEQGLINQSLANLLLELIKSGAKSLEGVSINQSDRTKLEQLLSEYKAKTDNVKYNIGYHALAVLAKKVVTNINSDTKFGEACLKFLNTSPIIQLHLKASSSGGNVRVSGFESKYPPDFKGTVALDASKVYAATGTNGRVTFAYNPTKGADELAGPVDQGTDAISDRIEIDADFRMPRSDIKARQTVAGTEKELGRKRRQKSAT
jgi:hypothetical protein